MSSVVLAPDRCTIVAVDIIAGKTGMWQELEAMPSRWPDDWIDSTCGSIDDPTFVHPPQGECEEREPLE